MSFNKYQRKTERKLFTAEQLEMAQELILTGFSIRAAARFVGAHETTLRKRLKAGTVPSSLGRFKSTFSMEQEKALVERIKIIDDKFYGISRKQLMTVIYQYAEQNNISHSFSQEKKMAGDKWMRNFCKKYSLTLRQPEKCSLGKAIGLNKVQFEKFHENLKKILQESPELDASHIFNMDESNVSIVLNKLPKVVSTKNEYHRLISKAVSEKCEEIVTTVCCMNAAGYYVPPSLIFPRKKYKPEFCDRAPPNTLGMVSDSGFINSELFINWLKHFTKYVKPSQDRPVLLILDNHVSHCSLSAIDYCQENGIILLSLPPHSSHKLQPLDDFFGPLIKFLSEECDRWMSQHPGQAITIDQTGEIFCSAYDKTASVDKAINAFKTTGIFPQNPTVFGEKDFILSTVTEKQLVTHPEDIDLTVPPENSYFIIAPEDIGLVIASTSEGINLITEAEPSNNNHEDIGLVIATTSKSINLITEAGPSNNNHEDVNQTPSTSNKNLELLNSANSSTRHMGVLSEKGCPCCTHFMSRLYLRGKNAHFVPISCPDYVYEKRTPKGCPLDAYYLTLIIPVWNGHAMSVLWVPNLNASGTNIII